MKTFSTIIIIMVVEYQNKNMINQSIPFIFIFYCRLTKKLTSNSEQNITKKSSEVKTKSNNKLNKSVR